MVYQVGRSSFKQLKLLDCESDRWYQNQVHYTLQSLFVNGGYQGQGEFCRIKQNLPQVGFPLSSRSHHDEGIIRLAEEDCHNLTSKKKNATQIYQFKPILLTAKAFRLSFVALGTYESSDIFILGHPFRLQGTVDNALVLLLQS